MYTIEYYSTIKENEIMSFVEKKWMKLEIIMLSKISQTEIVNYHSGVEWGLFRKENQQEGRGRNIG
jgi:hypothetical protein